MDAVYSQKVESMPVPVVTPGSKTDRDIPVPPVVSSTPTLTLTLNPLELEALRTIALPSSQNLHLSLSEVFCIEIATCLHPSVALRALSTRFFTLALRLVMRYEAHAAVTAEVSTPSFSKAILTQLMLQSSKGESTKEGGPGPDIQKAIATIDDLILLAVDLETVAVWLGHTFLGVVENTLQGGDEQLVPFKQCLKQQETSLRGTRIAVWGKVCSMLAGNCKKGLSAVRAVAAKYRMTNKPAPEVQSPYVDTILLPFRFV